MSVNSKHLATFILGAAAGVAMHKYLQTEEGEKLMGELKAKGDQLKSEAEGAIDKAPEYFDKLKTEVPKSLGDLLDTLKSKVPETESLISDLLGTKEPKKIIKVKGK